LFTYLYINITNITALLRSRSDDYELLYPVYFTFTFTLFSHVQKFGLIKFCREFSCRWFTASSTKR